MLPAEFYDPAFVPTGTYTGGGSCAWLPVPRIMRCAIASLAPGQTETVTITARLAADSRGKTVLNSIAALSDSVDPNPALATDTVSFVPIPAADLELTKVGPADPVAPGGVGRFTFQFANRGPSNAPDVILRDTLPDGLSFVGDTAGACSATGQAVTCALGTLNAGASSELSVDVRVDPSLAGRRCATRRRSPPSPPTRRSPRRRSCRPATPTPPTWSSARPRSRDRHRHRRRSPIHRSRSPIHRRRSHRHPRSAPAGGQPRLIVEKSVRGAGVRAGDELMWSVRVRNAGDAPARAVVLTDSPGRGLEVLSAQPSAGSCAGLRCSVGDLAAGAAAEVVLRTRATRRGRLANTAQAGAANAATDDARATVLVRSADVRLTKTSSRADVNAGDRVRFTLTVRSRARATLSGVRVCDRLPAGLSRDGGRTCWTLRLRAGETRRLMVTARAASLARTRQITNVATLAGPTVTTRRARAGVTIRGLRSDATGRCAAIRRC